MASFTDDILQFNPYVSDIPVDDYIRSGMEMQRRYNEGVNTAQAYISSVAGLPVATEADKMYLNKKLSDMRSRIESAVGADYGKQSFIGQIGNLANQIASDQTIRSGVQSSLKIQQLQSDAEQLRKEKPDLYSDANYERAMQYVNEYMEAGKTTAGLSYQGPTSIIRGTGSQVRKKILEGIKQIDPDSSVIINDNGQVQIKTKNKQITPEKIQTLIQGLLDSNDYQVLGNEGWYNMRGFSDDQVASEVNKFYADKAKSYEALVNSIDKIMKNSDNLSDDQKAFYVQQKSIYEQYMERYNDQANNVVNSFKSDNWDRDMATQSYWVDNLVSSMGQALQSFEQDVDYKVSPYLEAELTRANIYKALKDGKEDDLTGQPSTFGSIPINPDKQPPQTLSSTREQITSLEDEMDQNYLQSLKSILRDNKGQLTADADEYLNEDGNFKNKEALEKLQQRYVAAIGAYKQSASGELPYDGKPLPNNNQSIRDGHFRQVVLSEVKTQLQKKDEEIERKAKANLGNSIKVDFNEEVTVGGKKMKLGDVYNMFYEGTNEVTHEVRNDTPGGYLPPSKVTIRELKKGSRYEKFLKEIGQSDTSLSSNDVRSILTKRGFDIRKLDAEKDKLYKEFAKVNQPYQISTGFSDKDKKSAQYDILVKSLQNSAGTFTPTIVGEDAKYSDISGVDFSKADIQGGYYSPDGKKLYIRASFEGKGEGDKSPRTFTADFDVSELRKNAIGVKWFDNYFVSDTHPELTSSMLQTGKGTSFNEKDKFAGSLFITSRPDVGRNYQLVVDKTSNPPTFLVKVAVPIGKNQYEYRYLNDPVNPNAEARFPNAGSAIQQINNAYGYSKNIIDREKLFIKTR